MADNILQIGHPFIKKVANGRVQLCALITTCKFSKEMYFEVSDEYEDYLCTELADAFVAAMFYYAAYMGYDIECDTPVSERLLYQFRQYYIPTLNKMDSVHYKRINISAPISNIKFSTNNSVATAVSSGVDSFYSIMSHCDIKNMYPSYKLTHVVVANLFNKYDKESDTRNKYNSLVSDEKKIADELCLPMIDMYTNHHDFLFPDYVEFYSIRICSYALALQKLISVYLVSSGTMFQDSNFWSDDSTDYDVFNTSMASTQNITFYMSGGEAGRVQKIDYISSYDIVKKHLHVCTYDAEKNCSTCDKCLRTMAALDIIGKLDDFSTVFDKKSYIKRKTRYWGKVISQARDNVYGVLNIELMVEAKKNSYRLPYKSYLYAWLCLNPYYAFKNLLKKSSTLKRIYFKLKIDYLIYGKEKAELYRFGK